MPRGAKMKIENKIKEKIKQGSNSQHIEFELVDEKFVNESGLRVVPLNITGLRIFWSPGILNFEGGKERLNCLLEEINYKTPEKRYKSVDEDGYPSYHISQNRNDILRLYVETVDGIKTMAYIPGMFDIPGYMIDDKIYVVNRTPHPINIVNEDGEEITTYSPQDAPIRVPQESKEDGCIKTPEAIIPLSRTKYNLTRGDLPQRQEDTIYIVSSLVCQCFPDRDDFYIVNDTVRNNEGHIIGCRSLSRNPFCS